MVNYVNLCACLGEVARSLYGPRMAKPTVRAADLWLEQVLDDGRVLRMGFTRASKAARLVPVMLLLEDDAGITSASLRDLPIGEMDRNANMPESLDAAVTAHMMRTTPVARPTTAEEREVFLQHVAMRYFEHLTTTHRPAAAMAQESGVPVATVHRWIREARRIGHLPPARKGAAG